MKKVRITVKKMVRHDDLIAQYENPIEHACDMKLNQVFVCNGWACPDGFCTSAWDTVEVTKKNIATIFEVKNLSPRFFPPIFFYGKALEFSKIFDETEKKMSKTERKQSEVDRAKYNLTRNKRLLHF